MAPKVLKNDGQIISVEMINVSVKVIAIFGLLIPLITLILNTAVAFSFHSDLIFNSTYCPQNENMIFISISVLASHYPEKLIYNFCVLCFTMTRPFYSFAYSYFYYFCPNRQKYGVWYPRFCRGLAVESILELFASYFVICIAIDEHFTLHVIGFIAYGFFNFLGMGTNVVLHRASGLIKTKLITFYLKSIIWVMWWFVCISMAVAYPNYVFHCKPWAYPLFSIFEYASLIIISLFNACIYYDLCDFKLQMVGTWPHLERRVKTLLS